jgi:predicted nucleic acid-binding protein
VNAAVVDASVGVKWFLPDNDEELASEAGELLSLYEEGAIRFVVPDLFYIEIASAILKAVRIGRVSRYFADQAMLLLSAREFPTVLSRKFLGRASQIAADHQRSVYDSLYVAIALETNSQLITADQRLANALAARFPVKWLGAAR